MLRGEWTRGWENGGFMINYFRFLTGLEIYLRHV